MARACVPDAAAAAAAVAEIGGVSLPFTIIEPDYLGKGCYLVFETHSEGVLYTHWSETPVPEALMFLQPRKSVPAFKYKQNGGKSELIRGFRGSTKHRFFDGFCQFCKLAKDLDGDISLLTTSLNLFLRNSEGVVSQFPVGTPIQLRKIHAVCGMGPAVEVMMGVGTMAQDFFLGTGLKEGGSLAL